jgi:hypothetical protein
MQVASGDGWASDIFSSVTAARLAANSGHGDSNDASDQGNENRTGLDPASVIFFVSYFLLVAVVIMNVVVAVLIDGNSLNVCLCAHVCGEGWGGGAAPASAKKRPARFMHSLHGLRLIP